MVYVSKRLSGYIAGKIGPLARYEKLHEKVTQKVADLVTRQKSRGISDAWVHRRVEALKKNWMKRLNGTKNSVMVSFCSLTYCMVKESEKMLK